MAGCSFSVVFDLLFLCILCCSSLQFKADAQPGGCRAINFFPPLTGHYLKNHVISSVATGTRFSGDCEHHCLMTSECVSVNIGPTLDHKVICELSNSDEIQHPEDLIVRPGWTYRVTENFCSILKPCLNNAKCLNGYTDKKYLCVCASGFTGENCENVLNDVDECSGGINKCSMNASCINTAENSSCICNPGFTGDGRICSDCYSNLRHFKEYQDLPTYRHFPEAVEQFIIEESLFLAVANYYRNSESFIFKLNNLTGTFALHQTINIRDAYDLDYFMIADKHYLGVTLPSNSEFTIYQWNGTQFVNFQTVSLIEANKLHFFTILPERFLAITSRNNVTSIYKWKDKQFEKFMDIAPDGSWDATTFAINNECFIAIANYGCSKRGYRLSSSVYKWSGNSFVKTQSLQTSGAIAVNSFSIGGDTFLAFANHRNTVETSIDSFIYKWNGTVFTLFQSIPTHGAKSWHAFVMCGETYLGVANYYGTPLVYRFSGSQFIAYEEFSDSNANDMTSFEYKGETYLVFAVSSGKSVVYKWI